MTSKLILGDCLEKMKELPANSIDAVITDPPYGLEFMGKEWDGFGGNLKFQEFNRLWSIECLRVLKSGGFMFAMGGTRTHHRLTCGVEDAGFVIRDEIEWAYASGFPKAQDIASMIAKREGAKREGAGVSKKGFVERPAETWGAEYQEYTLTENAKKWEGYKTAQLKPSHEPIVIAQKPCEGSTTDNVMKYGVGGYNVDGCRIPYQNEEDMIKSEVGFDNNDMLGGSMGKDVKGGLGLKQAALNPPNDKGRFPPNLLVQDDVLNDGRELNVGHVPRVSKGSQEGHVYSGAWGGMVHDEQYLMDGGSFSKYFSLDAWWAERIKHLPRDVQKVYPFLIVPKAAKGEKEEGTDELVEKELPFLPSGAFDTDNGAKKKSVSTKHHPTVKPVSLMSYLITLSTREGATVLDPFMGSGTTGIAAHCLNRDFIGIEKSEEYFKIAQARIGEAEKQTRLVV